MIDYTTGSSFWDLKLNCKDGVCYYSKFILVQSSKYFEAMLTGSFVEGKSSEITLDFDVKDVNILLNLLLREVQKFPILTVEELWVLVQMSNMFNLDVIKEFAEKELCADEDFDHHYFDPEHMVDYLNQSVQYDLYIFWRKLSAYYITTLGRAKLISHPKFPTLSYEVIDHFLGESTKGSLEIVLAWIRYPHNRKHVPTILDDWLGSDFFNENWRCVYDLATECDDKEIQNRAFKTIIENVLLQKEKRKTTPNPFLEKLAKKKEELSAYDQDDDMYETHGV